MFFQDTTHQEIDDSFRHRFQQISEKITAAINQVITDTQDQQSALLTDANDRTAAIEKEYKTKLQHHVEELDKVRAQNLNTVQKDLYLRHAMIFDQARKRIDDLYEEANRSKMSILQETHALRNAGMENTIDRSIA